jgi:hypothetical protein
LLKVQPGLKDWRFFSGGYFQIARLEVDSRGVVWAIGREEEAHALQLILIAAGDQALVMNSKRLFGNVLPEFLSVKDGAIAVALTVPKGATAEDVLTTSTDGGTTWRDLSLPNPRIAAYCQAKDRYWVVTNRKAVHLLRPGRGP